MNVWQSALLWVQTVVVCVEILNIAHQIQRQW